MCFKSLGGVEPDTIVRVTESKEGGATKSLLTGDREGVESIAESDTDEGEVLGPLLGFLPRVNDSSLTLY